jgi:16S rRNA processing protein RimM
MEDGELIRIGEILKPHGVRGEVAASLRLDSPDCLDHLESLFLQRRGQPPREYELHGLREHTGRALLIFRGVEDRNAAEALRGCAVLIPAAHLSPLQEDEIYLNQLQGCEVVLEDGSPLGRIREVLAPAGNEVWAIDTPDGREVLFPAEEAFILEADPDKGIVRIAPPPGLLDLYLEG